MIAVTGFMGAGKSTVGRIVADRLGLPFLDADTVIEQRQDRTIRSLFESEGEAYFREAEHACVADLLRGPDAVVALGGGAVEDARTRAVLAATTVVYLAVTYGQARSRVQDDLRRPMLALGGLDAVYERRRSIYEQLATITVPTDGRRPDAVAADVVTALNRLGGRT